jgi:hypothetical protein
MPASGDFSHHCLIWCGSLEASRGQPLISGSLLLPSVGKIGHSREPCSRSRSRFDAQSSNSDAVFLTGVLRPFSVGASWLVAVAGTAIKGAVAPSILVRRCVSCPDLRCVLSGAWPIVACAGLPDFLPQPEVSNSGRKTRYIARKHWAPPELLTS